LFSEQNSLKNPEFSSKPHLQLDRPLTEYFVKSCYITPEGPKTAQLYQRAFEEGFRHFEIDLFGSEESQSINIASSKESAAPVELSEILHTLAKCITSDTLPVILTLKIHFKSTVLFRTLVHSIITSIQSLIVTFDQTTTEAPKLNELSGKILIRSSITRAKQHEVKEDANDIVFSELIALNDESLSPGSNMVQSNKQSAPAAGTGETTSQNAETWNTTISFDQSLFANFSNIDEGKALLATSQYFVSVSPKNSFQCTTPTLFYNFGVHSVVMPYKTQNIHSQINHAFFEHNGNCGYMVKPDDMADAAYQSEQIAQEEKKNTSIDQMSMMSMNFSQFPANDMIKVSISVICGRFMPDIKCKPFVHLELYGPSPMFGSTDVADSNRDVYRISPRWNNSFEFELPVAVYRQTVLQISLKDDQKSSKNSANTLVGTFSIHISSLRAGFRNVPLVDSKGNSLRPTSILIHTKKSRPADSSAPNNTLSASGPRLANNEEAFNKIVNETV